MKNKKSVIEITCIGLAVGAVLGMMLGVGLNSLFNVSLGNLIIFGVCTFTGTITGLVVSIINK